MLLKIPTKIIVRISPLRLILHHPFHQAILVCNLLPIPLEEGFPLHLEDVDQATKLSGQGVALRDVFGVYQP